MWHLREEGGRGGREREGGEREGREGGEVKRDSVRRKGSEERQKVNETNQIGKLRNSRGKERKLD